MRSIRCLFWITCASLSISAHAKYLDDLLDPNKAAQVPNAQACKPAEEFCKNPVQAICSGYQSKKSSTIGDEIRSEVNQTHDSLSALSAKLKKPIPKKEDLQVFAQNCVKVEEAVYKRLEKKGITRAKVLERIEQIKKIIVSKVRNTQSFKEQKIEVMMDKLVSGAQAQSAQDLFTPQGELDSKAAIDFYQICGIDGLGMNAFYKGKKLILCPGYLLSMLEGNHGVDFLDYTIGHELGHAIDPVVEMTYSSYPFIDTYAKFLDCMQKNYSKHFADPMKIQQYIKKTGIPALKAQLDEEKNKLSPDSKKIFLLQRQIEQAQQTRVDIGLGYSGLRGVLQADPNLAESHAQELVGDYYGYEVVAQMLNQASAEQRASMIRRTFETACDTLSDEYLKIEIGNAGDEGMHPSAHFRLEQFMRHPLVRELMGCGPSPADRPYCKME